MSRISVPVFISMVVGVCVAALADPPEAAELTAGFRSHIPRQANGGVNWRTGHLIAEGKGYAKGQRNQDRLMAERAATLAAARNALALREGLQFDANGRVANVREGRIDVDGVVKGHTLISSKWYPDRQRPECRVKLKVPLWGAKGVARAYFVRQRAQAVRVRRVSLTASSVDVSDAVLVIDARGTGVSPALFPAVVDENGLVIYDVATIVNAPADGVPVIRYVETELSYDDLRACGAVKHDAFSAMHPWSTWIATVAEPGFGLPDDSTSRPATRPASQPVRKGRRRTLIKAERAVGEAKTQVVLTANDAEKLRTTAEGASLLKKGHVVVVVDSAAAGIQGRLPDADEETGLAIFAP